jgi:hypothetical protein
LEGKEISKGNNSATEELNVPAVSAIAEVKQRWSVIGWVTKNYYLELLRALDGTLVPIAFAVVSTHQPALGPRGGLWPVLLSIIHREGLCPSSEGIDRLMMMKQQ